MTAGWNELGEFAVSRVDSGKPWHSNCYVVRHVASGEQLVIDPGGNGDDIVQRLGRGQAPRYLLLTHAHHDHVAAADRISVEFSLPCRVHPSDARLLRHAPMYAMRFGNYRMESLRNVAVLEDDDLPFAGAPVRVIPLPGHTAGGVGYLLPGMAFTGDVLFRQAVGRTDLPGGDAKALRGSVSSLLEGLDPRTILYPGHGKQWTVGEATEWWREASADPTELRTFDH